MSTSPILPKPRAFPPLEHFDYPELDLLCSCTICSEWRERLQIMLEVQKLVQDKFATCQAPGCRIDMKGTCQECRNGIKFRTSFLASVNRRDLYSECSFHAHHMEPHALGEAFMSWLTNVLNNRAERPDGWWVAKAPFLPIAYWLVMFKRSVALGEDDLVEEFSSDLFPNGAVQALAANAASGMG